MLHRLVKLYSLIAAFAATIPAANWLIGNVGTECIPNGPCLIPVGFGLMAPSGVLMIGAALVLRDLVQKAGGIPAALWAIALGSVLSWFIATPALVLASVVAFVLAFGELGVSILIAPPGEATLPIRIYTIIANTPPSHVAALALLQTAVILSPLALLALALSVREAR